MAQKSTKKMSKEENEAIKKWIYLMLSADNNSTIKGKIRLTKEFFLITKKLAPNIFEISQFYPHHFGPYSTRFAVCVNELIEENHIALDYKSGDFSYSLTPRSRSIAKEHKSSITDVEMHEIDDIKVKSNSQSLKSILKEIYTEFPKYALRSVIREDIVVKKINLADMKKVDDGPGFVSSDLDDTNKLVLKGEAAKRFMEIISR